MGFEAESKTGCGRRSTEQAGRGRAGQARLYAAETLREERLGPMLWGLPGLEHWIA